MTSPNILLISLDSLRADHLPIYGYDRDTTPTLSTLTAHNNTTLFENAFSTTAWTLPSHTSVFKGLYPSEHGVFDGDASIDPETTVAAKLSNTEYDTIAYLNNGWLTKSGVTDGFDERVKIFEKDTPTNVVGKQLNRLQMLLSLTDDGAKQTISHFEERHKSLTDPFFAFFHFMEPHYLYNPPRPHHRSYNDQSTMRILLKQRNIYTQRGKFYDGQISLSDEHLRGFEDLYDGEIKYIDDQLRRLFSTLKAREQFEDTMIVIFGDHGELFGEDGLVGHHFSLADALLRVPLLVKWPEDHQPITESEVSSYVELSDLFGTLLTAAGLEDEHEDDRTVEAKVSADNRTAYAEYVTPQSLAQSFEEQTADGSFPDQLETNIRAFRRENHKLVVENGEKKLYDLKTDSEETTDISDEQPDVVEELFEELADREGGKHSASGRPSVEFSGEVEEQLRELGYI